jgi:hypothetical protein
LRVTLTYTVSFSTKYGRQISAAMLARIAFMSILWVVLVSTVTVTSSPSASSVPSMKPCLSDSSSAFRVRSSSRISASRSAARRLVWFVLDHRMIP